MHKSSAHLKPPSTTSHLSLHIVAWELRFALNHPSPHTSWRRPNRVKPSFPKWIKYLSTTTSRTQSYTRVICFYELFTFAPINFAELWPKACQIPSGESSVVGPQCWYKIQVFVYYLFDCIPLPGEPWPATILDPISLVGFLSRNAIWCIFTMFSLQNHKGLWQFRVFGATLIRNRDTLFWERL